jgi:NADH-quinone oxidoreductase subunit L
MFRSYFMTFTGTYRGGAGHKDKERMEDPHAVAAHAHAGAITAGVSDATAVAQAAASDVAHQHDTSHGAQPQGHDDHSAGHDDHGHHGGVPHESPKSMTYVLIALAFMAVVSGFVSGWPKAWGGHEPVLEKWLAPSLPAAELVPFQEMPAGTEILFQLIGGLAVAGAGCFAAYSLYNKNESQVPAKLKSMFPRAWSFVFNKYYVDEFYAATVIKGSLAVDQIFYWFDQNVIDNLVNFMSVLGRSVAYLDNAIDKYIVDGAVNGIARLTWNSGRELRRLQTGRIHSYLFGALGGAIVFVILQYVIR